MDMKSVGSFYYENFVSEKKNTRRAKKKVQLENIVSLNSK